MYLKQVGNGTDEHLKVCNIAKPHNQFSQLTKQQDTYAQHHSKNLVTVEYSQTSPSIIDQRIVSSCCVVAYQTNVTA